MSDRKATAASLEPSATRRLLGQDQTVAANRAWWDDEAAAYHAEHGEFLGDAGFVWGPEGWSEAELDVLKLSPGQRILEIGGGAAQCARWIRESPVFDPVEIVSTDLSVGMLRVGTMLNGRTGSDLPLAACDGTRLPFADGVFDTVFTSYGVVPFVADSACLMQEVCRVLRPGGRFAFSTTHPIRWAFPDVPGPEGLTAHHSYFDRTPYVESERTAEGDPRAHGERAAYPGVSEGSERVTYAEHHRTMGDRVRELVAAGFSVVDIVEPEWPDRNPQEWGGWSPLRGRLLPGTAIFVAVKD